MAIKEYFRDQYNCKAPLRSPAHITLHMPVVLKVTKEKLLVEKLSAFAADKAAFDLQLDGFGAFAPRVIYTRVVPSDPLKVLQKALTDCMKRELGFFNADYKSRGYNPHITVAFRDLKKALFPAAWAEFEGKSFKAEFHVSSFWLLKHDGKVWQPYHEFLLRD